ncbi:MAG TPA: TlpA disulfide reductase family protein [Blastocatellia bacterium]|nr:TlpA disulfide reductase family protein [Blastocatellia bacterium]
MSFRHQIANKLAITSLVLLLAIFGFSDSIISVSAQAKPVNFSLRSLGGGTVTSSSLSGKVVVLAIGGKNDPLDRSLLPQLQKLIDRYQDKPVAVVWVSGDSERAGARNYASDQDIRSFVSQEKFTGTVARDPDGALIRSLGANQLPTIAIIDKRGNLNTPLIVGFDPDSQATLVDISSRVDKLLA